LFKVLIENLFNSITKKNKNLYIAIVIYYGEFTYLINLFNQNEINSTYNLLEGLDID